MACFDEWLKTLKAFNKITLRIDWDLFVVSDETFSLLCLHTHRFLSFWPLPCLCVRDATRMAKRLLSHKNKRHTPSHHICLLHILAKTSIHPISLLKIYTDDYMVAERCSYQYVVISWADGATKRKSSSVTRWKKLLISMPLYFA